MPKAGYEYMLKNLEKHGGMSTATFEKLAKRITEERKEFLDANDCRKLLEYMKSEKFLKGKTKNEKRFNIAVDFLEAVQEAYAEYERSHASTSSLYKQQRTSATWLGGGKIAHALFTDKNRPKQLEILEECRERMKKGQMTPTQYYGVIAFLQDSIKKSRYESRLQGLLKNLSDDLIRENPSLANFPREQAKEQFRIYALTNPSMLKENLILKEVRAGMGVEKIASEAVNIDRFATVERREAVASLIEKYTKPNAVNDEYNKSRSRTSRLFQDKSRVGQLRELELVMQHLNAANIPEDKRVLMLTGCLLTIRDNIQKENPKNKNYVQESSLGKMVSEMLKEIKVPPKMKEEDVQKFKDHYTRFKGIDPEKERERQKFTK